MPCSSCRPLAAAMASTSCGRPRLDVFRGKETGKIAPDNLFHTVALDALRPGIPTHNPALRVEHENGVVLNSVEQHPVLFFAVPQRLFCLPASGVAALQAPARGGGDQQTQQRSEDQNALDLAQAPSGVLTAQTPAGAALPPATGARRPVIPLPSIGPLRRARHRRPPPCPGRWRKAITRSASWICCAASCSSPGS